ncbi:hypothetical protein [Chryseobacterium sp. JV274]|uniref:hypothetical protein n=1 Tax=Chryseobacterium sp. JV274 TaxID=1932669 RepID=UPI0009869510|nr:hypothetical protein [Chryseobacterium sp. JV274]
MEKKFNFYQFLLDNGYEKEVIRERSGKTFATVYQKEIEEKTWNALTVHQDKRFTASSISGNLEFKEQEQPTCIEAAQVILEIIEKKSNKLESL